ncbi:MAG: hypothetical protein HKN93_12330 [Acidimicrobiia bacterium]|nr:hypothetical protein [Acidimicrobiia bacterium]
MVWIVVTALAVPLLVWAGFGITTVPPRHVAVIDGHRIATGLTWRAPLLTTVTFVDMTARDLEFAAPGARGVLTIEPDPRHLPPVPFDSFRGRASWFLEQSASVPDITAEWGRHVEKLLEASGWVVVGVEAARSGAQGIGAMMSVVEQLKRAVESGQAERALEEVTERIVGWVERAATDS